MVDSRFLSSEEDGSDSLEGESGPSSVSYFGVDDFGADASTLKLAQGKINALGYSPALKVDGIAGPKTDAAVAWARSRFALGPGGLDVALLTALGIVALPPAGGGALPVGGGIAGLQPSVVAALPALFGKWEGKSIPWMYLDEKGYVTTGTGNLIDPVSKALPLGWILANGAPASASDITAAWNAVDALRTAPKGQKQPSGLATKGGYAFQGTTSLRLSQAAMDRLVLSTVTSNQNYFMSKYPGFATFPADAQLAFHSLAWAWGSGFSRVWGANGAAFDTAIAARDFAKAAEIVKVASQHEESINPGIVPRDIGTEAMFQNASSIVASAGDVARLFYPATAGAGLAVGLLGKSLSGISGISGLGIPNIADVGFVVGGIIIGAVTMGLPGAFAGGLLGAAIDAYRRSTTSPSGRR